MSKKRCEIEETLAERLCWQVAKRDDDRIARVVSKKNEVNGVYHLDQGAILDEFFHFLETTGVSKLLSELKGEGIKREMVDFTQYVMLYGLKTLFDIESLNALPELLFSDEAVMQLVGFNARQIKTGVCERGHQRKGKRTSGPICPDTLGNNIVKINLEKLAAFMNEVIQALAKAKIFAKRVTGIIDSTDIETTDQYEDCGQVTREKKIKDKYGKEQKIEVTVYGWKLVVVIDLQTKIPLAAKVVKIQEHEVTYLVELVKQAQVNLGKYSRLYKVLCDRGFVDGEQLWELNQRKILFVVPGKSDMAVVQDAHALAQAGEDVYVQQRTVRVAHGSGKNRYTEDLCSEVVGIPQLTSYDQYGTVEQAKQHNRKAFQANPINAVVVRKWNNHDYGLGGKTVFLTNDDVTRPLTVFDDYDGRSLIENCCMKATKQQWSLQHPPQKTEAAVHVHVLFTLAIFALTTAFRLLTEQLDHAREPRGWQRWRRLLFQQNRDKVIVFAGEFYGIFTLEQFALLLGLNLKIGTALPRRRSRVRDLHADSS